MLNFIISLLQYLRLVGFLEYSHYEANRRNQTEEGRYIVCYFLTELYYTIYQHLFYLQLFSALTVQTFIPI